MPSKHSRDIGENPARHHSLKELAFLYYVGEHGPQGVIFHRHQDLSDALAARPDLQTSGPGGGSYSLHSISKAVAALLQKGYLTGANLPRSGGTGRSTGRIMLTPKGRRLLAEARRERKPVRNQPMPGFLATTRPTVRPLLPPPEPTPPVASLVAPLATRLGTARATEALQALVAENEALRSLLAAASSEIGTLTGELAAAQELLNEAMATEEAEAEGKALAAAEAAAEASKMARQSLESQIQQSRQQRTGGPNQNGHGGRVPLAL